MAGINWTSDSINSFFRTSLNQSSTGMNGLYSLLGDRNLIKSGGYHKLMDAYVKKVKTETDSETKKKVEETKKESDKSKTEEVKKATTYNNKGSKKDNVTLDSVIDQLI